MKNKSFDCVEMKRKGAEAIYRKVSSLSIEQQLEYWHEGSATLRQQIKQANEVDGEWKKEKMDNQYPTNEGREG